MFRTLEQRCKQKEAQTIALHRPPWLHLYQRLAVASAIGWPAAPQKMLWPGMQRSETSSTLQDHGQSCCWSENWYFPVGKGSWPFVRCLHPVRTRPTTHNRIAALTYKKVPVFRSAARLAVILQGATSLIPLHTWPQHLSGAAAHPMVGEIAKL